MNALDYRTIEPFADVILITGSILAGVLFVLWLVWAWAHS